MKMGREEVRLLIADGSRWPESCDAVLLWDQNGLLRR